MLKKILLSLKRQDIDAKVLERAERQRMRRAEEREAGVVRPRPKPVRVELVEDADLPARRAWSHVATKRAKKKPAAAPEPPAVKGFANGTWSLLVGAEKGQNSGELPLDNLELTPPPFKGFDSLIKSRVKCRETAAFLLLRYNKNQNIAKPLFKAATKISNCSLLALWQSITPATNYKLGTALCKCRLCPNCQRVLAAKRKSNFVDWFLLNAKALRGYFFYHMVLTVRHSTAEGVRTGMYAPDMLLYFAQLRGTCTSLSGAQRRQRSAEWKDFIAGGSYSMEMKPAEDGSPNIHIHCLLVARKQLTNKAKDSKFMEYVRPLWKQITGDSENVFVKPLYYLDENRKEIPAFRGSDVHIDVAVSECMKYTLKADSEGLEGFSDQFLVELLSMKKRYYARFGCLSGNDKTSAQFQKLEMLASDFQDLEKLTDKELARLFDPETGELVDIEQTSLLVAPFKNMVAREPVKGPTIHRPVIQEWFPGAIRIFGPKGETLGWSDKDFIYGGEPYYSLKPSPLGENHFFPITERKRAAILLSRVIKADYGQPLDLPEVFGIEAEKGT